MTHSDFNKRISLKWDVLIPHPKLVPLIIILPSRSGTTIYQVNPNHLIPALLISTSSAAKVLQCLLNSSTSHCAPWLPSSPPGPPQNLLTGSLPRSLLLTVPKGFFLNACLITVSFFPALLRLLTASEVNLKLLYHKCACGGFCHSSTNMLCASDIPVFGVGSFF